MDVECYSDRQLVDTGLRKKKRNRWWRAAGLIDLLCIQDTVLSHLQPVANVNAALNAEKCPFHFLRVLPKHLTPVRGDDELSFDAPKRNSFTGVLWDHAVFLGHDVNADNFL